MTDDGTCDGAAVRVRDPSELQSGTKQTRTISWQVRESNVLQNEMRILARAMRYAPQLNAPEAHSD